MRSNAGVNTCRSIRTTGIAKNRKGSENTIQPLLSGYLAPSGPAYGTVAVLLPTPLPSFVRLTTVLLTTVPPFRTVPHKKMNLYVIICWFFRLGLAFIMRMHV